MPIMGNVGAAMTSTHQVSGRAESLWGWARRQLSGDRNGVVRLLRRNRQRPQGDSPERTQAASGGVPSQPPDLGIDPRVVRDTLHAFVDPIDGHVKRVGRSSMPVIVRRQTENFRWLSVKVIDGSIQAVYQDRRGELHLVRIGEDGSLFPDGRVHVRQSWGQSTSLGAGAVDDLIKYKNPSPRRLLMPRTKWGDVRLDLSSAVPDGETASLSRSKLFGMMPLRAKPDRKGLRGTTAIEAAAVSETKRAKAVCNGWTPLVVASAMGQGATSIDKLMKGGRSGDYENRMVLAEYLQSLWGERGVDTVHDYCIMRQGQSDIGNTNLGRMHEEIRASSEEEIRRINGQRDPLVMLAIQESSFFNSAGVLDMFREHVKTIEDGGHYFLVNPSYAEMSESTVGSDLLHHTALGYWRSGVMCDIAYRMLKDPDWQGRGWDVMRIIDHTRVNNHHLQLRWSWDVFVEDAFVSPIENHGLEFPGRTVESIVFSGDTMDVFTRESNASLGEVRCALMGHIKARRRETIPRSTICGPVLLTDRDGFTFRPRAVHHVYRLS